MKKSFIILVIIWFVLSGFTITAFDDDKNSDFLTLNLGESKEGVNEKLKLLQDSGEIKQISQSENGYQTNFLNEAATFTTFFYKEQLIIINITFQNQFNEAEYNQKLRDFIINKTNPGLNALYGAIVNENQFPDPTYFNSRQSAWLARWGTTNLIIESAITKNENQYLISVSLSDRKLFKDLELELRKKTEESKEVLEKLKKKIEEQNSKSSS